MMIIILLLIYRPDEFIECDDPVDHVGNTTASQELGYGCLKVGFVLFYKQTLPETYLRSYRKA